MYGCCSIFLIANDWFPMLSDCATRDVDAAIDDTVEELLKAAGIVRPPIDATVVADRLGITMVWDERQSGRARISMTGGPRGRLPRPTVFLRPDPRPERIQWALAHELGEAAIDSLVRRLRVNSDDLKEHARENLANRFASRLLLPTEWFAATALDCDRDLVALKEIYSTASHELIGWRMLDLAAMAIVSLFDQGRLQARRSNLPGKLPAITSAESDAWRRAHETGKAVRRVQPLRIDAWPIHEPAWRREIVRLEVVDADD